MRRLMLLLPTHCLVVLFTCHVATAVVVEDQNVQLQPAPPGIPADHTLMVYQNAAASDPTGIFVGASLNLPTLDAILTFVDTTVDEGSDWYLAQCGDAFWPGSITAGQFEQFAGMGVPIGNSVTVPNGEFVLGVATSQYTYVRNVFGWARFSATPNAVDGVDIELLGSAVAYEEDGIVVCTTQTIPEPASWILTLALLCGLLIRRRSIPVRRRRS